MPDRGLESLGQSLLALAHQAISGHFGLRFESPLLNADDPRLGEPGATFVTLTQEGQLRGCIGSLTPWRTLEQDVRANAVAAAFHDSRFLPLEVAELPHTRIEVSRVGPATEMTFADEADALAQLRDHPGLILDCRWERREHRATFLPQVWENLPIPHDFLEALKRKAGLPAHFWSPDLRLSRYAVDKWKEPA